MSGSSLSQDTECPVCGKCVSIQGRNGVFGKSYVSKITSCCSKVKVIHYKCAELYSTVFILIMYLTHQHILVIPRYRYFVTTM